MSERSFGAESTTDEVLDGIDLSGRSAIVTGASSGLGQETSRALAARGASVTLAARNAEALDDAASAVRDALASVPGAGRIETELLDLTDLDSIRDFAKRWQASHEALHILINNAGVMACPLMRTSHGWEMQLATNHVGHFLLTCLLAPALRAGAPARVVNLSSGGHRLGDIDFDDPQFERREYDKWTAYGQSKTANVLFSVELDRRLGAAGVHANAVHPGMIMTPLARHLGPTDFEELMKRRPGGGGSDGELPPAPTFKSVEAGAATSVWAATAPELEGRGGLYLEDCGIGEVIEATEPRGVAPYALDPASARRLWTLSEELVGEQFDLA